MAAVDISFLNQNVDIVKEEGFYANYTPTETLGYGATSVVRKCTNHTTQKEYAVKIIEKTPIKEHEVRAEIYALTQLSDDPNIIGLIDAYETENHFFLVFELARGGELFDYLNYMITVPEKEVCKMMHQILKVVSHMHNLRIVHRDLKPENILLTVEHNLLVSDFGFAVQLKPNQKLKELCGTPDYLAPEVLKCSIDENHVGYGLEVDIWACGVITYLLLVGFSPFWHRKENVMIWNIMDGKYSFEGPEWRNISDKAKDFISKLLVVIPQERLTVLGALSHSWFETITADEAVFYKPRISFKVLALSIMVLKNLYDLNQERGKLLTGDMVIKNPYMFSKVRKIVDTCAFAIYGHWVKRSNNPNQNRAAIYENKPKADLCDEERCLITKPYQYKLSYKNKNLRKTQ